MSEGIVFTFGRFNPPTIGHRLVVSTVIETAKKTNSDHAVYLSQTCNYPSNPLTWEFKRRICETAFQGVSISSDKNIKTPFQALESFKGLYKNVVMVVGSDQQEEFSSRMQKYADEWEINLSVISAGIRLCEDNSVAGISATKMRQYAQDDNKTQFFNNLPQNLPVSLMELVFENTKKGLELKKVAK